MMDIEGSMRPSKAVMTNGPGSLIDLKKGKSGIVMSPDYWHRYEVIKERRLAEHLGVTHFRCPKEGWVKTSDGYSKAGVMIRRFPYLWRCPRCKRLQPSTVCRYCGDNGEKISTVPPRLISACEGGHIQDFPWHYWVECEDWGEHTLRLRPSDGRSDLEVHCPDCDKTKNLAGALGTLGMDCSGKRPWIGDKEADEDCDRKLHGLMRGGSNVYFPITPSSILIPRYSYKIYQSIINYEDLDFIKRLYDSVDGDTDNEFFSENLEDTIEKYRAYIDDSSTGYDETDFRNAFLYHCTRKTDRSIKREEWEALSDPQPPPKRGDELEFHAEMIDISNEPFLDRYFDGIVAVKRLTEVIAQTGFTRINPPTDVEASFSDERTKGASRGRIKEEDDFRWDKIIEEMRGEGDSDYRYKGLEILNEDGEPKKSKNRNWLPGVKNKGEGIFFIFDKERIVEWEQNTVWEERTRVINQNRGDSFSPITGFEFEARGLLLHTFSHLLISQIAKECGYQLASVRERIYSSKSENMYGVLLYTSTPDSQGSLGGLISQVQDIDKLKRHIINMMEDARVCSQDPLCGHQDPSQTEKPWGASCHACTNLPETSCEVLMNQFLDRKTILGLKEERSGYFSHDEIP